MPPDPFDHCFPAPSVHGTAHPGRRKVGEEYRNYDQCDESFAVKTMWGSRGCDWGVAAWAPRPAPPLDTGFRRYDDEGGGPASAAGWGKGEGPAAAGRALREAPLRGLGESGMRRGLVVGAPHLALPLWIPAFAGMTRVVGREQ